MIGEMQQEINSLKKERNDLYKQKNYFMDLLNKKVYRERQYHNNLIELIENETDIKELKKAFEYIKHIKKTNSLNSDNLKEFERKLNNKTIFNLCLLLIGI